MKYINFELDTFDLVYILNCMALTRNLLYKGDKTIFEDYFNKEDYTEHNWNLWLLQKRLLLKGNKEIFNSKREDMFWGQIIYLEENKSLNCFRINKEEHKKKIKIFEKNYEISKQTDKLKNKYFKFLSIFKKTA